jgi:hypothetical protein
MKWMEKIQSLTAEQKKWNSYLLKMRMFADLVRPLRIHSLRQRLFSHSFPFLASDLTRSFAISLFVMALAQVYTHGAIVDWFYGEGIGHTSVAKKIEMAQREALATLSRAIAPIEDVCPAPLCTALCVVCCVCNYVCGVLCV